MIMKKVCPNCNDIGWHQTTGSSGDKERANCTVCGWRGIVGDLRVRTIDEYTQAELEEVLARKRVSDVKEKAKADLRECRQFLDEVDVNDYTEIIDTLKRIACNFEHYRTSLLRLGQPEGSEDK